MNKFLILATSALVVFSAPAFAADSAAAAKTETKTETTKTETTTSDATKTDTKADAGKRPGKAHGIQQADANGDGTITKEEFMANSERVFGELDNNSDGKITKEEVEAKKNEWRKKMKEIHDQRAAGKAKQAPAAKSAPAEKPAE